MEKIVLCVDNGNRNLESSIEYLLSHQCRIYRLKSMMETEISRMIKEIEEKEGRLDILLLAEDERIPADGNVDEKHDMNLILQEVSDQVNGVQAAIEGVLPLMKQGGMKRIGMITSADSSIRCCQNDHDYGRHMTLAGLNMLGKLYFNLLRPEGFTFRWYCADVTGGMSAGEYLLTGLCYDEKEPYQHSDENRFVMRDAFLREIPW